jgi:hypothetical protein
MNTVRCLLAACCLAALAAWPALAGVSPKAPLVTIYNQGFALIEETRSLSLPAGTGTVEFPDVPETIVAASARLRSLTAPDTLTVTETAYDYDLITPAALLNRYLGKNLKVVLPDPTDKNAKIVKDARLLSNNERPIFETDQGVYLGSYDAVIFPETPKGLRDKPALVLGVDNKGPAEQVVQAAYLADGFSWRADYTLWLDPAGDKAAFDCLATIANQTGKAITGAELRLVAGEVRREEHVMGQPRAAARNAAAPGLAMAMADAQVQEEPVFEYHLFRLERPVDLGSRQTKQLALFSAQDVGVEKELRSRFDVRLADRSEGRPEEPLRQTTTVSLKIKNDAKNNLGRPLPAGVARVYQRGASGETVFLGEDTLPQLSQGGEAKLALGAASGIQIERRLADYKKIGKNTVSAAWEITVKSGTTSPAMLILEDRYPGSFTLKRSSQNQTGSDARALRFAVPLARIGPDKPFVLTYEAEYEQ